MTTLVEILKQNKQYDKEKKDIASKLASFLETEKITKVLTETIEASTRNNTIEACVQVDNDYISLRVINSRTISFTVKEITEGNAPFFTKDKTALINENVNEIIYRLFTRISKEHGVQIVKWAYGDCSVQMLLSISPSTNLTKYINATKASSSRLLKKEVQGLSLALPDGKFWGRGFYAFSLDAKIEKTKNKKRVNIK